MKKYSWYDIEGLSLSDIMALVGVVNTLPYSDTLKSFKELLVAYNCPLPSALDNEIVEEWFSKAYARYFDDIFVTIIDDEGKNEKIQKKLSKVVAKLIREINYYSTILNGYKAQESKLLDNIKTSTDAFSGFNDTPQNQNIDNKYSGNEYLSNYSKSHSESESPLGTPMARLREVQDSYRDVMDAWVLSFNDFFYEEENL